MIQFLVHHHDDTVGVATVDVSKGQSIEGRYLDTDQGLTITAAADIPLGHKIALRDHPVGGPAVKYGHDIGRVTAGIDQGRHVHVHNLKTNRW